MAVYPAGGYTGKFFTDLLVREQVPAQQPVPGQQLVPEREQVPEWAAPAAAVGVILMPVHMVGLTRTGWARECFRCEGATEPGLVAAAVMVLREILLPVLTAGLTRAGWAFMCTGATTFGLAAAGLVAPRLIRSTTARSSGGTGESTRRACTISTGFITLSESMTRSSRTK